MLRSTWLGCLLPTLSLAMAACAPASTDDHASPADEADLVAGPEINISRAGGAEVAAVKELSDGALLVVDNVGGIRKVDRDLKRLDFRPKWVPDKPSVYVVDGGASILYVGWAQMSKLAPDGALVPTFGKNGVVSFPYAPGATPNLGTGQGVNGDVAMVVEETRNRTYTSASSYYDYGPLEVSLATIDTTTGEVAKKVRVTLPKSSSANGLRIRKVLPLHDGTFALVISKTEYGEAPPNVQAPPRTRYSLIRTAGDQALAPIDLVVGSYDRAALTSLREEPDGTLKLLFRGSIDVPSVVDQKLFEAALAPGATTPTITTLGDAAGPSTNGFLFNVGCGPATARTSDGIVSARSTQTNGALTGIEVTRFGASGQPEVSLLDKPNRCVRGVFATPSNLLFVSYWNTTEVGWTHDLLRVD